MIELSRCTRFWGCGGAYKERRRNGSACGAACGQKSLCGEQAEGTGKAKAVGRSGKRKTLVSHSSDTIGRCSPGENTC